IYPAKNSPGCTILALFTKRLILFRAKRAVQIAGKPLGRHRLILIKITVRSHLKFNKMNIYLFLNNKLSLFQCCVFVMAQALQIVHTMLYIAFLRSRSFLRQPDDHEA
ncbi:hypothetical protein, partial [Cedecea sp. P7760]|uniref:hypothetical protein n=1 Tax=Cedecea sp. P7760 TaxID=2726983 RepID=UPI001C433763